MDKELVTVKIYRTAEEAHVDRLALADSDIQVFVENENYELGDGPSWPADGVRLAVPRDQAARALGILEARSG